MIIRIVLSAALMGNIAMVAYNLATPRPVIEHKVLTAPIVQYLIAYIQWLASGGGSGGEAKPPPVPSSD